MQQPQSPARRNVLRLTIAATLAASLFGGAIIIGLLVENLVFRTLEARTVKRWGMQN